MPSLETSLEYCTYCPKLCRHTCPVSNAEPRETLIPQAKMATMRRLRNGHDEASVENAAALYGCTGCGACTEACHHGITPGVHLLTGRAEAERRGDGHPALAGLVDRFRVHARRAAEALTELYGDTPRGDGAVGLLPACEDPAAGQAVQRLAARAGEPVEVARVRAGCGGYPLLAGGHPEAFRLHAEAMAADLAGYRRVLVGCPACAWAMKVEYPLHGVPLAAEIVHPTEHLAPLVARLGAATATGAPIHYHDPCFLGRRLGVYEAPRALLSLVRPPREFSRARAEAECSGGGGLLPLTMPATAEAIADTRLDEVVAGGATEVATACASCKRRLTRRGVIARDVIELVDSLLP